MPSMGEDALKGIPGARKMRAACACLAILSASAVIMQSACLGHAITELWHGSGLRAVSGWIVGFMGAFVARLLVSSLQDALASRFAEKASGLLQRAYMDALASSGPALVHAQGQAACVLDATEGVDRIEAYLVDALPKMAQMMVVPLLIAAAIACFDPLSGLITIICYPLIIVFMRLIGHTASDDAAQRHAGFAQMSNHFIDALRGLSTLRAFGRAKTYGKTVFAASEGYRRHVMRTLRTATLSSTVLDIFATCGLAAVAIMLGFRMVDGEVLFYPALCVLLLVPEFFMPIRSYARSYHATLDGRSALAALERAILFSDEQSSLEVEYESIERELDLVRALERPGVPDVRLEGVNIAHGNGPHVLSDVHLDLSGARMVIVSGPSGAGKSSLLDIIAGFANPASGRICVNGQEAESLKRTRWQKRVACIQQRPHIFCATLRANVSLYRPDASDEDVLRALAMVGLGHLGAGPEGLDLLLGDGGRRLSGGEAHRIALARALVDPSRDVVILDEPTAHLDIECELSLLKVLTTAFSDRLVVMATHDLLWADMADMHVEVSDGVVSVQRCRLKGAREAMEGPIERPGAAAVIAGAPLMEGAPRRQDGASMRGAPEGGEEHAHGAGSRRAGDELLRSLLAAHAPLAVVALLLSCAAALFACGLMFTSGYMISVAASLPMTVLALHLPSIFVRIFGVGKPLIDYVERLASHDWVLRATSKLRQELFDAAERGADAGRSARLGEMLASLSDDIKCVQDLFIRAILPFAVSFLLVIILSACAFLFSPLLGCAVAVLLVCATLGCAFAGYLSDRKIKASAASHARKLCTLLTDDVMGLRDVILSGRGRERMQRMLHVRTQRASLERTLAAHRRARAFVCQLLMGLAIVACLAWSASAFAASPMDGAVLTDAGTSPAVQALAAFAVQNESPWPPNWIAAFAICLFPVIEFVLPATEALLEGSAYRKGADRLAAFLRARDDGAALASERPLSCPVSDSANAVELRLSGFSYPDSHERVLSALELDVPQGAFFALIGPSGAGKSTLMHAIAHDLPGSPSGVRTAGSVGLIEQESYIFNKSLRENLLIAKGDASDDELEDALKNVGLSDLLARLPKGLDSVLAAGGEDVSGGEATRIAVARSLLAGFDIILLDEPFRALDPDTESAVMDTMRKALAGKTVIVVTHHLQTIRAFDRAALLEEGQVKASGAPDELLRENERIRSLIALAR